MFGLDDPWDPFQPDTLWFCDIDVPTIGTSQKSKIVLLRKYCIFNSLSEIISWNNPGCAATCVAWRRPEASPIERTLNQGGPVLPSPQLSQCSQHMSFHKVAELSLPLCSGVRAESEAFERDTMKSADWAWAMVVLLIRTQVPPGALRFKDPGQILPKALCTAFQQRHLLKMVWIWCLFLFTNCLWTP